jgi:CubicO group peptidase (beta-lactamase class C family)
MTPHGDIAGLREGVLREMDKAGLTACQVALAAQGELLMHETFGSAPPGARFLICSATKPVFASIVWQLIGEGLLDPAAPLTRWWPEFGRHGKDGVTLEQVMVHTAGLPNAALSHRAVFDRELRVAEMQEWTLEYEPGTQYAYHGLSGHWLLAELVQRLTGDDYRAALRERVLDPLGLERLELGVPFGRQGDIQPIERVGAFPALADIEHLLGIPVSDLPPTAAAPAGGPDIVDELARPDVMAAGVPGGGAVSDAAALALFYQHLMHDPQGLWNPQVLADAKTNVRNLLPDGLGRRAFRTLGLETAGDDEKTHMRIGAGATSPTTFGHAGAGGQVAWADPASGLSFVFLTSCFDMNFVRMYQRDMALTRLAARCASSND